MPPRRRSRTEAQQEVESDSKRLKAERTDSSHETKQDESKAVDVINTVAKAWKGNDRYMRRKRREYIHEVIAAKATLLEEESLAQKHAKKKQPGVQSYDESEEPEALTHSGGSKKKEAQEDGFDENGGAGISYFSNVMEDKNLEETYDQEEKMEFVADPLVPEPLSPDRRSSLHSPPKITNQTPHKTSAIEPTPEKSAPPLVMANKPKKGVARGIALSSSSASTRKRMISFSPERAPRPENEELALKKLEKNLKTNEKLEQRLKSPAPLRMSSPAMSTQTRRPSSFTSPNPRQPMTCERQQERQAMTLTTPPSRRQLLQSPLTAASHSSPLSQTDEVDYDAAQAEQVVHSPVESLVSNAVYDYAVVLKEETKNEETYTASTEAQSELGLSQEFVSNIPDNFTPLSKETYSRKESYTEADGALTDADISSGVFTSTSVIGDVGLFNCETDVEYTGGVYGEGTDGKVAAAVINGQKVALKRAKPQEGFSENEAKHRAALELHYLRRVRHVKGFLQCLGLCDAIEHTCIALEVMDCKLSDYLRRYGVNSGGSKHRRYTLSFDDAKMMLKKICLSMITLHEDLNVAHGDLACRNILMRTPPEGYEQSWEPDIKLSDFGRIKLPSDEPNILTSSFSFHKNCDVGAFGREILYRLLVGEIVPKEYVKTRSLHKLLQDVTVTHVSTTAKARLGPYLGLFMRCTAWGVRPTFREIYEHLDDLEYFETIENGLFPLKPTGNTDATFMSPVAEGTRHKTPTSSASRAHQRETSTGLSHRSSGPRSRLFSSKSITEVSGPGLSKPVNWLKSRYVGVQRSITQQAQTPTARQLPVKAMKKTPPSTGAGPGASKRSLQILNQIQHRTIEKGRKST
ncbi:hypothetical protein PsorP6_017913 [Peronosclerospora sorghi]|uniref:Uncharacterized protein n=1 Tax=Peronosclerospora sorghi TaxID=230839 RepID=A0ACC0WCP9_9STRA|nr:hypothetical protein PsorP6_017913 [Peronosclerospora sorghi]